MIDSFQAGNARLESAITHVNYEIPAMQKKLDSTTASLNQSSQDLSSTRDTLGNFSNNIDTSMSNINNSLESIKKGVLYSKDDGDGDTYSMIPPTEDVVSSYSVDVTKDNGKTVHIGDYSTVDELDKAISDAVKNGQLTQEEADSVQK